jgi:hypothetical protein
MNNKIKYEIDFCKEKETRVGIYYQLGYRKEGGKRKEVNFVLEGNQQVDLREDMLLVCILEAFDVCREDFIMDIEKHLGVKLLN